MKKTITLLKTIFIISFFFAQTGWSFASASSNEIKFLIQNEKITHIEDAKNPPEFDTFMQSKNQKLFYSNELKHSGGPHKIHFFFINIEFSKVGKPMFSDLMH